ncbi:hypothetical protein P7D98_18665 [Enterococcus avium]|uniref:hypothetical protein n=1 Tax=Enterococcus avium TaxID=33945 RepID=UPI002891D227|nr:hypothetical protein [Enterococcus avium]MDT2507095.1 hypothetical protein [Enterococcus avium]
MFRSLFVIGLLALLINVFHYLLCSKFERIQMKDALSWKQGNKRNRYELYLAFDDGRFAFYHLFANYSKYQANDLLLKLFEGNSFVGIEENGRVFYYRISQIIRIESQKVSLKLGKKGLF